MMGTVARVVGVAMVGIALVLAAMLGPPLFMAIPWGFRWWLGELGLLGLVLAAYGWALRTCPPRGWAMIDPERSPERGLHRVLAVALQLLTLSFLYPFFARHGYGGIYDWDLHLTWFEAIRQSVLRFHQFPWWNPWTCDGFPLAAEPQVGIVSLDTLLVLPFGTETGLKLSAVASLMLATEGARRLARLWLVDPWGVALAAAVYAWNGAIVIFTANGHALTNIHPFLPWLLYYAFRIGRGVRPAAMLGAVQAASVLTVIQYPTAYDAIIAAAVLLWGFLGTPRGGRLRYLGLLGVAAGVFLTLAGWRLALSGLVLRDYPRTIATIVDNSPGGLLHALLDRVVPRAHAEYAGPNWDSELASYVGPIPVLLAVASLRRSWRWWHTLAFAGFALAMGSHRVTQPSYWMLTWPGFSTMHMVGRWRLPALLGLGLAAGSEVQAWRAGGWIGKNVAAMLAALVLADLAVYAQQCLPLAFGVPPAGRPGPGPEVVPIISLRRWEDPLITHNYEAMRRGYAVVEAYCPMLGYDRDRRPTARLWRGHPGYVGEVVADGRPLAPESWSPNRIVLRGRPGQAIEINQNPGNYWHARGRPLFPGSKCAELTRRFVANADDRGSLVVEARPPAGALRLAAGATLAGLVLLGGSGSIAARFSLRPAGRSA